jgi:hypothetical protein
LIEPFTRRERHVDLAASNRIERRLAFKPIMHESETLGCDGACEILQLENPRPDFFRLTRSVTLASGATAKLTTDGADLGDLLDRIESVPLQRHFQWVGDIPIARSYRLAPKADLRGEPMAMVLTAAEARLDGLTLSLKADAVEGYPAEIDLSPQADHPLDLPEDLLATLGRDWRVLSQSRTGWTSTLRAKGREPDRSRRIEAALEKTVAHLARTLAEPPRQFHERFVRARWGVVFRRLTPVFATIVLLAGSAALAMLDLPQDSVFLMMSFNFPPLLLVALFAMRELPRLEIPPLPRASSAPSWFPSRDPREAPETIDPSKA